MPNITIDYSLGVRCVKDSNSLLIVGNIKLLQCLKYDDIKIKLPSVVTKEGYNFALNSLHPNPTDTFPLYLNSINLAGIANNVTHYNCTAQPHFLTELVGSWTEGKCQNIVIVCEKKDVFPSGCAVAKAFPTFSRKTFLNSSGRCISSEETQIRVEFLVVQNNRVLNLCNGNTQDTKEDVELSKINETLKNITYGIQLTARIIDTPCNEMNVDHFIELK